ncbi:hypothetical protein A8B75_10020 [Sphingomonadales bacterium EhC05]|nr:hypothetical protein A8B75_10020 [Sphingomonadales bacterium EhC05]
MTNPLQIRYTNLAAAKTDNIEAKWGVGTTIIIENRMSSQWVKYTGSARLATSEDYTWFTDNGGDVYQIADTGTLNPLECGAVGDCVWSFATNAAVSGTDDRAAVQAAFDYFAENDVPGEISFTRLHRITSEVAQGPMRAGLVRYGDNISLQRRGFGLVGCAFDGSVSTVNYRGLHLSGGNKISIDTASNRVVDKTGYDIAAAISKDDVDVLLGSSSDASNFVAGDIVFVRTGQTLAGTTEPDSELNIVKSVSGATVTMKYPVAVDYAQERYKTGSNGLTTISSIGNLAPFQLVNVTDRVVRGGLIDIDLIGHNCEQVLNIWGAMDITVMPTCRIIHGKNGMGSRESRNINYYAQHKHTARANNGYFIAPSTGCTHWRMKAIGESEGYAYFHLHESVKEIFVEDMNLSVVGNVGEANPLVDVLARNGMITFKQGYLNSGASTAPSIGVGSAADVNGNYCDGPIHFGAISYRNNAPTGNSAIRLNGANVNFSSDPIALGHNDRLSIITYLRDPCYGVRIGDRLIGPFVHDRQLILGKIGQDAEIVNFRQRYDVAFASGDKRLQIGYSGDPDAYMDMSSTNLKSETAGTVTEIKRHPEDDNAGPSLGAPQSSNRTIVAQISGGGSTDYTSGKIRITAFINRTSRTA